MKGGVIRWIDIPATDVEASAKFYEDAFGWKITRSDKWPDYPMYSDSEDRVGGGFDAKLKPSAEAGIFLFITVDSIEEARAHIEAAGGEVVSDKALIHESVGWWASFRDVGGNLVALWERPEESVTGNPML